MNGNTGLKKGYIDTGTGKSQCGSKYYSFCAFLGYLANEALKGKAVGELSSV